MGIANYKENVNTTSSVKTQPAGEPETYKHNYNNNQVLPVNSLISHIEGTDWAIDYYSQDLEEHNDLTNLDSSSSGAYQHYTKIINLEIKITQGLTHSFETKSNISLVEGQGYMLPYIKPNIGDVFISKAGTHKAGLYTITNVERMSYEKKTAYLIAYRLVGVDTQLDEQLPLLESKVVRTYHFHRERLIEGQSPLLLTNESNQLKEIHRDLRESILYYFKSFFSLDDLSLVIPIKGNKIYDDYLVQYLLKVIELDECPERYRLSQLDYEKTPDLNEETIWSVLLKRDFDLLPHINHSMNFTPINQFKPVTALRSIFYTDINYVVSPTVSLYGNLSLGREIDLIGEDLIVDSKTTTTNLTAIEQNGGKTLPLIPTLDFSVSYVLPLDFYQNDNYSSVLEKTIREYLLKQPTSINHFHALIKQYRYWGLIEQYYFLPILFIIGKTLITRY